MPRIKPKQRQSALKRVRRPEGTANFFLVDSSGADVGGPFSSRIECEQARAALEGGGGSKSRKSGG